MKKQKNKEWGNIKKEYPINPIYYKRYNYVFIWAPIFIITIIAFSVILDNLFTAILAMFTLFFWYLVDLYGKGFIYEEVK